PTLPQALHQPPDLPITHSYPPRPGRRRRGLTQHRSIPGSLPLLCGFGLSGEDLVVERLELYWGKHPQRAVEAPVVVPVDPAGGRELDVRERPEGSWVEDGGADAFGLEQAVHRFHEG